MNVRNPKPLTKKSKKIKVPSVCDPVVHGLRFDGCVWGLGCRVAHLGEGALLEADGHGNRRGADACARTKVKSPPQTSTKRRLITPTVNNTSPNYPKKLT